VGAFWGKPYGRKGFGMKIKRYCLLGGALLEDFNGEWVRFEDVKGLIGDLKGDEDETREKAKAKQNS
jgi:hypothetical protein